MYGKLTSIASLILAFVLSGSIGAQTRTFSDAECIQATTTEIYSCETWNFSIGTNKYEIDKSGHGKKVGSENVVKKFKFSIDDASNIDTIYYVEFKGDLLLLGELNFGDGAGGFIIRIDGKSLKTKWRINVPSFNVAKGLIENDFAYLAAMGFISKINLDTGKYIWKHEGFYRKYDESWAFNIFLTPELKGDTVIFKEEDSLNRGFDHQLHVNKLSGKINKVVLN